MFFFRSLFFKSLNEISGTVMQNTLQEVQIFAVSLFCVLGLCPLFLIFTNYIIFTKNDIPGNIYEWRLIFVWAK